MKEHVDKNNVRDRTHLGTCFNVLGTKDQLIIMQSWMKYEKKKKLGSSLYDYQKAYDMVRHDWMMRVHSWMGVPDKVLQVIREIMKGWKTRLEVKDDGTIKVSRWINIRKGYVLTRRQLFPSGILLNPIQGPPYDLRNH